MKNLGHIRIGKELRFEYYELEKPKEYNFYVTGYGFREKAFNIAMDKYEASKRSVEVGNVILGGTTKSWIWTIGDCTGYLKDNQPCSAEVSNNKAVILEIL